MTSAAARTEGQRSRMGEVVAALDELRGSRAFTKTKIEANKAKISALETELADLQRDTLAAMTDANDEVAREALRVLELGPSGRRRAGDTGFAANTELDPALTMTVDEIVHVAALLKDMRDLPVPEMRDPLGYARNKIDLARRMFEQVDGSANSPVNSTTANVFAAIRSFITSTTLGSAALTAITDAGFGVMARQFAGLPTTDMMGSIAKSFTVERRREAVRAGLILDNALHVLHSQARYAGSLSSTTWTGFLADRVIAMQGLAAWTQAGKHAFGLEFQGLVADNAHLSRAR
jgi:hypothetical protein